MTWTEAPSLRACTTEFLADTGALKAAACGAFALLSMRIFRHGPIPDDDTLLAGIARVGRRTWENRIKPAISHLLLIEDGFVYLPVGEEEDAPEETTAGEPPVRNVVAKIARSERARIGWINRRARKANGMGPPFDAPMHRVDAPMHQTALHMHTSFQAKSMPGAFAVHAFGGGVHVQDASTLAHPRLSLSETSIQEFESPTDDHQGEREAGAREGNADLHPGAHAKRDADAQSFGAETTEKAAVGKEEKRPVYDLLPDDWVPNEAAKVEARARSCDVFDVARKFRNWAHENNKRAKDWDARFINWLIDERAAPDRSQGSMPQVIRGGAGAADRERTEFLARRMAEARRGTGTWDE